VGITKKWMTIGNASHVKRKIGRRYSRMRDHREQMITLSGRVSTGRIKN
jgi:hypothetical protein